MEAYGIAKKSKSNYWDADDCDCELCSSTNRKKVKKKTRQEGKKVGNINNYAIIDGEAFDMQEEGLHEYFV